MMIAKVPTTWKVKEPRSGRARIPFVQRCTVTEPRGECKALICDLSVAGAYVRLDPPPRRGATLGLSFHLFPADPQPVVATAEVVWRNAPDSPRVADLPPGCGLRFLDISADDSDRIAALVHAYAVSFPTP